MCRRALLAMLPGAAIFQRLTQYKLSALAPLTWDYLRLMSTPNHRRHFGALGATGPARARRPADKPGAVTSTPGPASVGASPARPRLRWRESDDRAQQRARR